MRSTAATRSWTVFGLAATSIAIAWVTLIRLGLAARHPSLAAAGAALDLVGTMPFVYWLVIVRRGVAPPATLVLVAAAGLLLARAIVPGSPRVSLVLVAVAEVAILVVATVTLMAGGALLSGGWGRVNGSGRIDERCGYHATPGRRAVRPRLRPGRVQLLLDAGGPNGPAVNRRTRRVRVLDFRHPLHSCGWK